MLLVVFFSIEKKKKNLKSYFSFDLIAYPGETILRDLIYDFAFKWVQLSTAQKTIAGSSFLPFNLLSTPYKNRKPPILGVENTDQHSREGNTSFYGLHRRLTPVWKTILESSNIKKTTYTSTAGDPNADWSRNSSLSYISGHTSVNYTSALCVM